MAGRITYASQSWREILGYDPETILGKNAFEMVHPEDREAVRAEFEHTFENPDARAEAEYRIEHGGAPTSGSRPAGPTGSTTSWWRGSSSIPVRSRNASTANAPSNGRTNASTSSPAR